MNLIIYICEIEPKVAYIKWYIVSATGEDDKFKEELKQEVDLNIKSQFGGNTQKVY